MLGALRALGDLRDRWTPGDLVIARVHLADRTRRPEGSAYLETDAVHLHVSLATPTGVPAGLRRDGSWVALRS